MDKIIALIVGILFGVGQFFLLRYALKPLAEGRDPKVFKVLFFQMPIPFILLLCCAFINPNLLPFVGSSFCLSLIVAAVINYFVTQKRRYDI
jgi:hypothetical protein